MEQEYKLLPKSKNSWVGKKYENALLVGFGKKCLILKTKIKGKKRSMARTGWSIDSWKVPVEVSFPEGFRIIKK